MTLNVTFAQTDDFDVSFAEANETISVDVSTQTGTINGTYTTRVYGVKLYDLIGG